MRDRPARRVAQNTILGAMVEAAVLWGWATTGWTQTPPPVPPFRDDQPYRPPPARIAGFLPKRDEYVGGTGASVTLTRTYLVGVETVIANSAVEVCDMPHLNPRTAMRRALLTSWPRFIDDNVAFDPVTPLRRKGQVYVEARLHGVSRIDLYVSDDDGPRGHATTPIRETIVIDERIVSEGGERTRVISCEFRGHGRLSDLQNDVEGFYITRLAPRTAQAGLLAWTLAPPRTDSGWLKGTEAQVSLSGGPTDADQLNYLVTVRQSLPDAPSSADKSAP